MSQQKRFPILDAGFSIPWSIIEPYESQAIRNHDQSLGTLASRGGLSASETYAVMHGLHLFRDKKVIPSEKEAKEWLRAYIDENTQLRAEIDDLRRRIEALLSQS